MFSKWAKQSSIKRCYLHSLLGAEYSAKLRKICLKVPCILGHWWHLMLSSLSCDDFVICFYHLSLSSGLFWHLEIRQRIKFHCIKRVVWFRSLLLICTPEIMGVDDVIKIKKTKKPPNSFVLVATDSVFLKLNFPLSHCVILDTSAVQC